MHFLSKLKRPQQETDFKLTASDHLNFGRSYNRQLNGSICKIPDSMIFRYGTAGFRYFSPLLPLIVYRIGAAMAIIVNMYSPEAYGIVFTASHNSWRDNGVKIVYRNGLMLPKQHVEFLEYFVNLSDAECHKILDTPGLLETVLSKENSRLAAEDKELRTLKDLIDAAVNAGYDPSVSVSSKERLENKNNEKRNIVILARDTRESGEYLEQVFELGFKRISNNIEIFKAGYMPTATHHFLVAHFFDYEDPLATLLNKGFDDKTPTTIHVDCANGVGVHWVHEYFKACRHIDVKLYNNDLEDKKLLNNECGADYVQSLRLRPDGIDYQAFEPYTRFYHLDGDCDRMVMTFYCDKEQLHIFDGDHLLLLFIAFIRKVYENSNGYRIGAVHTGYANSGLILAIQKIAEDYPCLINIRTGTGVAKLIKGSASADMAVYFEPNGHGSILVSPCCKAEFMKSPVAPLFELTNPAIGDGIANIRAIEYMLCKLGWSTKDWLQNSFERCPTRLTKIPVNSVLKYASHPKNEEILIQPACLQSYIEDTVRSFTTKYGNCNVFLRPSGTENYMRLKVDMEKDDDPKALELLVSVIENGVKLVEKLL
uniref:Alpha-D-phosphohexomutase alpha/beta/alpha domain-containing protein n=1 Tax=Panagrolaimus superbus TaxID=310955 RepID=A0A914YW57_9BILA